ncbi:unnamed protein product [Alopecurus aequalis]
MDSRLASLRPHLIHVLQRVVARSYPDGTTFHYGETEISRVDMRRRYGDVSEFMDEHRVVVGADHGGRFGAVPASEVEIARLPVAAAGKVRESECGVCVESFEAGETLRIMPCPSAHGFHENCIVKWLRVSRLCPLCRFAMPAQ